MLHDYNETGLIRPTMGPFRPCIITLGGGIACFTRIKTGHCATSTASAVSQDRGQTSRVRSAFHVHHSAARCPRFNLGSRYKQQNLRRNEPESPTERARISNGDPSDLRRSGVDWTENGLITWQRGAALSITQSHDTYWSFYARWGEMELIQGVRS